MSVHVQLERFCELQKLIESAPSCTCWDCLFGRPMWEVRRRLTAGRGDPLSASTARGVASLPSSMTPPPSAAVAMRLRFGFVGFGFGSSTAWKYSTLTPREIYCRGSRGKISGQEVTNALQRMEGSKPGTSTQGYCTTGKDIPVPVRPLHQLEMLQCLNPQCACC